MKKELRKFLKVFIFLIVVIISINFVSAWIFNGTVRDVDGNLLNNTVINITFWMMGDTGPSLVGANSTTSNESGWFNLSVYENSSYMYRPVITHINATTGALDYIGQSLPQFPYREFANTSNINFYLRPAGTINITAVYRNGSAMNFRYQVKDVKLGYPIASEFNTPISQATVYVPRDRNYSIMIYPNQAMPISFDWTNFTAGSSYDIVSGLSTYNVTTYTVNKKFNCTDNLIRVSGYIQNTSINDFTDWSQFTVVPYLLEPGNMIYLGDNSGMPYNMSQWNTCTASVTNLTNAYINSTGYQLTPTGKSNYIITAIWNATGGLEYNLSISLGNATTSASGLVTNASELIYSNVSLSYTYGTGCIDNYNLTSGFYNITLPGPEESATYILFATASNGTSYYGGYRNLTLNYSNSATELNFTMYSLMSTNWGATNNNISLNDAITWTRINISSARQQFNLINSTNHTLSDINAHLEIKVDYTTYNATEFTFMTDISSGSASFYLPLLNASVKEMNIYSQSYSPKRVGTKTAAQILTNSNITLTAFNPGDIDGADISDSVSVALYHSNSTCNLPNPESSCILADSATMDNFNPLSSIIGGGKINFRMGLLSSGIIVQYINVDMLASGPPDALFDDSATTSTTGNFESAMRFGSNGPTIYDYVIISMPYTQGSTSVTGLNESADVNMSIPLLYDESWGLIWNASANGTNGTSLAGNQSHYSTYSSQWQTLMGQNNCTKNQSNFNSTNPCYIDTSNNRIWIRLPHFSGTKPSITGGVVTATSSSSSNTSSSTGSGSVTGGLTYTLTNAQLKTGYTQSLRKGDRLKINVSGEYYFINVTSLSSSSAEITITPRTQIATFNSEDEKKIDVNGDGYYDLILKLNSIVSSRAYFNVKSIYEKIPESGAAATGAGNASTQEETGPGMSVGKTPRAGISSSVWIWIIIGIVILILLGAVVYYIFNYKTKKRDLF